MLYRVVQGAWAGVRAGLARRERPLPRFCAREVEAFLRCGILAHGFARVWCAGCDKDDVVAFSCKGRGFCPSCGARRMADTAAWLVDRVIPDEAPVRQWVLSLPHRLRVLRAYDPDACALVRRVLLRTVSGWYEGRARRLGLPRPRTGAVAFVQRFDSGLRLDVHFHVLWLDGVFAHEPGHRVAWHEPAEVTDANVARLVRRIRDCVAKALRRAGKWQAEDDAAEAAVEPDGEQQLLLALASGAVAGRGALGDRAGEGAAGGRDRAGRNRSLEFLSARRSATPHRAPPTDHHHRWRRPGAIGIPGGHRPDDAGELGERGSMHGFDRTLCRDVGREGRGAGEGQHDGDAGRQAQAGSNDTHRAP